MNFKMRKELIECPKCEGSGFEEGKEGETWCKLCEGYTVVEPDKAKKYQKNPFLHKKILYI